MKKLPILLLLISFYTKGIAQESKNKNTDTLLKELAENGCKCVDSINVYNKANEEIAREISICIDEQTGALQLGKKLMNIDVLSKKDKKKEDKKQVDIAIDFDKNSEDYKKAYYELERYMMSNCSTLKDKVASTEKQSAKSVSENKKALEFYSKGLSESKNENFAKAIEYFEKAVKEDPEFAFAWDNLGISYRRLNNFDKAIASYEKSLALDPNGLMPLQNIAIVYQYKKEFVKAIAAYERLAKVDANNPEVFYGIGNVYVTNLKEYEKGLDSLCKAYNLYYEQKSPYRTDAESLISMVYAEMKKQGKEEQFNQILKENNISQN